MSNNKTDTTSEWESDNRNVILDRGSLEALKDYKVFIEYKHLRQQSPSGVYVVPSFNKLRLWYGAIFLRKGLYAGGIFRFSISLPPNYNDIGTYPSITFSSEVFNPCIEPDTGILDLCLHIPYWDPPKHQMITALTVIKNTFYMKDFTKLPSVANSGSLHLLENDPEIFLQNVQDCVKKSQERVYDDCDVGGDDNCCLRFSEPRPQHNELWEKLFSTGHEKGCEAPPLLENIQVVMNKDSNSTTGAHDIRETM